MATAVLTFRVEQKDLDLVRKAGENPAEVAKRQFQNYARGIRVEAGMREAQQIAQRMGWKPFDASKAVREARDDH